MNHLAECMLTPAGQAAWRPILDFLPLAATVAAASFALGLLFRWAPFRHYDETSR